MKIGILTFHNAHNHGATLQCWALQEYLKEQGNEVEIINYRLSNIEKLYRIVTPRNPFKVNLLNKVFRILQYLKAIIRNREKAIKYFKFEHFIRKSLNLSCKIKNYRQMKRMHFNYDVLIVGSDQVWNGNITKGLHPAFFLNFGNDNIIRIAYAASIGKESLTKEEELFFIRYLRELDYISVRENNAKSLIKNLTQKNINVVCDPTLLIEKKSYDSIRRDPKIKQKFIYVHNVHLKRIDENLASVAEELSLRLGLPVVHNFKSYNFKNEFKNIIGYGPKEHIGFIANAEFVISNSFHTTVFSIIYNKKFITVPHHKIPERKRYLLKTLGLDKHLISDQNKLPQNINELIYNYKVVKSKAEKIRTTSIEFLNNALNGKKRFEEKLSEMQTYFDTKDIFSCYGCAACKYICPNAAISMEIDAEGFWYPCIESNKCTSCNLCKNKCIYSKNIKEKPDPIFPTVYAAYNKDNNILENSSSGGVFSSLCSAIINKQGYVVGVRYDKEMSAIYDIADNMNECKYFRGSKYVAADIAEVKPRVKSLLENRNIVLFSGTPCQIAGLKSYLGNSYDNLYTVEVICHGTPSPKVFRHYIDFIEAKFNSKVVDFQFRNKSIGWNEPLVVIKFLSKEDYIEKQIDNYYSKAFLKNLVLRPSCYICEFASLKKGISDITIGDYWGIEKQHPQMANKKGVSIVKVNNEKGSFLFTQVREDFVVMRSTYNKAYAINHKKPVVLTMKRNQFMSHVDDHNIAELFKKL